MGNITKEQATFWVIRYISLIGEALSQALKDSDFQDIQNVQLLSRILEMCFDRCEHIAQYELEVHLGEQFRLQNLARNIEWLQIVMDEQKLLLSQGIQRHSSKPTPEMLQQLLIRINQLAAEA